METRFLQFMALSIACAVIPGCLLNSVHRITTAPRQKPDSAHAIVVIGIGLDTRWPFTEFAVTLDEYSAKKQDITGNCFRYNRIDAMAPSSAAKVTYFAYEVPAGTYAYSPMNANAALAPPTMGSGFIAPPGRTVYFGDYVFVGNQTVVFRRDIDAARSGIQVLLPRNVVLEAAATATTGHTHPFLCTP